MARILLIDDEAPMRDVLRLALVEMGHEVTEAVDGKVGLAEYQKSKFDLVITDLVMPKMEGVETIIALRQLAPKVKIIAFTGKGRGQSADYLALAGKLGATRTFLTKPFIVEEFIQAVNEVLNAKT